MAGNEPKKVTYNPRTFENIVDKQNQFLNVLQEYIVNIEAEPDVKQHLNQAIKYSNDNLRTFIDNHNVLTNDT